MIKTLAAVALLGAVSAERASVLYPHVPLVLWSQRGTFNAQQTYVNAVVDDKETLNVLHNVLTRDTDKDVYNVLSRDAQAEPSAEALCVFVHETLKPSELVELGAESYVQTAIKSAKSSVVIAHTTRSQSLTDGLKPVDHAFVAIDKVAAWIQSAEAQKLLTNGKTDLVIVQIPDGLSPRDVDAKIKTAATALLAAAPQRVDFALTGNSAQPVVVKDPFARSRRSRRLAAGQNVTAASIICEAGDLIGIASNGKAYCFSHYVHMTPQVLTALLFGFFFLFLAYVGISVLHAIQTPQRYPLHGPPKGKEF